MIEDLANAIPFAIDSELAELDSVYFKLVGQRDAIFNAAHQLLGERRDYQHSKKGIWPSADTEAFTQLALRVAQQGIDAMDFDQACDLLGKFGLVQKKIRANRRWASWLDGEYDRRPWTRFFLVVSSDGHIHSNTRCSSFPRTQHGWQPELSGKTEAEAVAKLGPRMCTKCFSSAPVEWTQGIEKPVDPTACSGHGKYATNIKWCVSPVGTCPDCSDTVSVTSTGKVRKHKPKSK
jgi:hypothetical protein